MSLKSINGIIAFAAKNCGKLAGKALKILPLGIKNKTSFCLRKLVQNAPGKFYALIYPVAYEMIKHMYFNGNTPVNVEETIIKDIKMRLNITQKTQRTLYLSKPYEPHISNFLVRHLKAEEIFIDIGAHIGYYALLAAKLVGPKGMVIAFEPEKQNFAELLHNVELNGFKNVICAEKAIGETKGTSKLYINPLNEGGHSLKKFGLYKDSEDLWSQEKVKKHFPTMTLEQDIETTSLDDFLETSPALNKIASISVVKIDVEGYELSALAGMKKLLTGGRAPRIVCEVNKNNIEKVFDLLKNCHYYPYRLNFDGAAVPLDSTEGLKTGDYLFIKQ